ncbi:hypothetical protein BJV74DRAFT_554635 [Russula compacta]|nr:hypothetical protein BJV74DRAFT_554635 [Russula compacta]
MSFDLQTDQDGPAALTTLIKSAICEVTPRRNLKDVLLSIQTDGLHVDLDALSLLPFLLPCPRDGTDELLALIARHCSAKEIVMVVQEVVERFRTDLTEESDDESESAPLIVQLIRLLSLLTKAIPRLALRKSLSRTLAPLVELQQLLPLAAKDATVTEGRSLVRNAALIVQELGVWVKEKAEDDLHELTASHALLESFLNAMLESCADLVQSYIAQRVFEQCFPRLSYRPVIREDWKDGEDAVLFALRASHGLGCGPRYQSKPSLASLVLIAHEPTSEYLTIPFLVSIFPLILTSLQSNVLLDATLAILLKVLCTPPLSPTKLSPDIIIPLTTVLPLLCSAHPDASMRHITFRILGHVLQLTPPIVRLQILRDLVSPSEDTSPYMRTAAIGLVKEAVLEGLLYPKGENPKGENVFASPFLLQTIGPYVFRLDPPDLLASIAGVGELKDSPEPARLVECLNLYYVLLLRDVDNRTGIRDPGTLRTVESSFLAPIRSAIAKWNSEVLPLAAMQISLERVEDALKTLT